MKVIAMKKLLLLLMVVSILFAGCFQKPEATEPSAPPATQPPASSEALEPTQESTPPLSGYQTPMVSFSSPTVTETYGEASLVYTFQVMELLLEDPQVSEWVTLELLNHTDFASTEGPRLLAEATEAGESVSFSLLHTPARLDRGILSLISHQVISGNGPKATGVMASSTFDLVTGRQLSLKELLVPQYDAHALSNAVIDALEPLVKEGMLYSDYAYVVTELFSSNAPVENWYLSQSGLCIYFAPYEIAPYNLGNVTAEIPYEALSGLLREEYFPGEVLGLVGNPKCSRDMTHLQSQSQFRDLILDKDGSQWIITVDGAIEDLRIESAEFPATVFAASTFCQGDVIVITASEETAETLSVTYRSGGETFTVPMLALFPV